MRVMREAGNLTLQRSAPPAELLIMDSGTQMLNETMNIKGNSHVPTPPLGGAPEVEKFLLYCYL